MAALIADTGMGSTSLKIINYSGEMTTVSVKKQPVGKGCCSCDNSRSVKFGGHEVVPSKYV